MFQHQSRKDFDKSVDQEHRKEISSCLPGLHGTNSFQNFTSSIAHISNLALSEETTIQNSTSVYCSSRTVTVYPTSDYIPGLDLNSVLSIRSLSASFSWQKVDQRYFELFHQQLTLNFCSYFGTGFWTKLVPQECPHEPAVRYAIFALAALIKPLICNVDGRAVLDPHLSIAFMQYGKAIRSLCETLAEDSSRVRLALITSVLLGCFESFQGSWSSAMQHVHSGLNILRDLKSTRNSGGQSAVHACPTVEPEISQAIGHLSLKFLIVSFLTMTPLNGYPYHDLEYQVREGVQDVPERFKNLDDAFPFATRLVISSLLLLRKSSEESLQPSTARDHETLGIAVARWNRAFGHILIEASHNMICQKHLKAIEVHIGVAMADIVISSICKEGVSLDSTARFQYIVSMSRQVLEKEQESRASTNTKVQPSLGLLMCLYYTATKCRNCSVRQKAIAVLKEWPSRYVDLTSSRLAELSSW